MIYQYLNTTNFALKSGKEIIKPSEKFKVFNNNIVRNLCSGRDYSLTSEEISDLTSHSAQDKGSLVEDKVHHPSHYTWIKELCGIEVIDITRHLNFNKGNIIKYVLRAGYKDEKGLSKVQKEIEDLKKAQFYIEDEIKRLENKKEGV